MSESTLVKKNTLLEVTCHSLFFVFLQYYYNGNTGQFLYWDAEQSTYLPAPTGEDDKTKAEVKEEKKEGKDKKEKVKVAKKIAKVRKLFLIFSAIVIPDLGLNFHLFTSISFTKM